MELAVCAEMVFLGRGSAEAPARVSRDAKFVDRPITERVRRIDALGFQVEIWSHTAHDVDALARTGATFSSMTGYIHGSLVDADGGDALVGTARECGAVAERLGCPRLNLHGTELDAAGVPFARAVGHARPGRGRGRPGLRMMLDVYHAQVGEGDLIALLRRAGPLIGEIQVADVPGRCEPGTGEINYPMIAAALRAMGYHGTVGLEAYASGGDDERALERFRTVFAHAALAADVAPGAGTAGSGTAR